MSSFGYRYVVDTNTLGQLGRRRRASEYFKSYAVLTDEVLREARNLSDLDTLRKNLYATTSHVLEQLVQVMRTVPIDDKRLVDLYRNKGGADPLLIACALDGQYRDSVYLDAPEWVVVTADDAVRRKAEEFGLRTLTNTQFAAIIDSAAPADVLDAFENVRAEVEPA